MVAAEEPKTGGTLIVATTNDTPDLDIQKYPASSQHNALLPLYDGLVEKDWTADADFPADRPRPRRKAGPPPRTARPTRSSCGRA